MQLMKYRDRSGLARAGVIEGKRVVSKLDADGRQADLSTLFQAIGADSLEALVNDPGGTFALDEVETLAPIDAQEVWGAGVTYLRSKKAREDESEQAATFYDQVYQADRPELFFKATPHRVVGPGAPIRVRADSRWTVPEPELALVLTPAMKLVGFTLGNDVSARDIEGRNPLYLPQAKVYDACCALGPTVAIARGFPALPDVEIVLEIDRDGSQLFSGSTSVGRMARRLEELVEWLGRDNSFPTGVILLTGTGIVPPDDLSLRSGDLVRISCAPIGTLENPAVQG